MKVLYIKVRLFFLALLSYISCHAQSFTEPSKLKQFDITVNFTDYTVKTQMLSQQKKISVKSDLTYMWYASQKIMETKGGFDGKLIHGFYKSFYLNNQLKEQGSIKYGLKHKTWKSWDNRGVIRESITWKDGIKNGEYKIYNDLGQLMAKGYFKKDKLNGKFYTYNSNGVILEKKKYKDGVEIFAKVKIEKQKKPTLNQDSPKKEKKSKKKKQDSLESQTSESKT